MIIFRILKIFAGFFLSGIIFLCDVIRILLDEGWKSQSSERKKEMKSVACETDVKSELIGKDDFLKSEFFQTLEFSDSFAYYPTIIHMKRLPSSHLIWEGDNSIDKTFNKCGVDLRSVDKFCACGNTLDLLRMGYLMTESLPNELKNIDERFGVCKELSDCKTKTQKGPNEEISNISAENLKMIAVQEDSKSHGTLPIRENGMLLQKNKVSNIERRGTDTEENNSTLIKDDEGKKKTSFSKGFSGGSQLISITNHVKSEKNKASLIKEKGVHSLKNNLSSIKEQGIDLEKNKIFRTKKQIDMENHNLAIKRPGLDLADIGTNSSKEYDITFEDNEASSPKEHHLIIESQGMDSLKSNTSCTEENDLNMDNNVSNIRKKEESLSKEHEINYMNNQISPIKPLQDLFLSCSLPVSSLNAQPLDRSTPQKNKDKPVTQKSCNEGKDNFYEMKNEDFLCSRRLLSLSQEGEEFELFHASEKHLLEESEREALKDSMDETSAKISPKVSKGMKESFDETHCSIFSRSRKSFQESAPKDSSKSAENSGRNSQMTIKFHGTPKGKKKQESSYNLTPKTKGKSKGRSKEEWSFIADEVHKTLKEKKKKDKVSKSENPTPSPSKVTPTEKSSKRRLRYSITPDKNSSNPDTNSAIEGIDTAEKGKNCTGCMLKKISQAKERNETGHKTFIKLTPVKADSHLKLYSTGEFDTSKEGNKLDCVCPCQSINEIKNETSKGNFKNLPGSSIVDMTHSKQVFADERKLVPHVNDSHVGCPNDILEDKTDTKTDQITGSKEMSTVVIMIPTQTKSPMSKRARKRLDKNLKALRSKTAGLATSSGSPSLKKENRQQKKVTPQPKTSPVDALNSEEKDSIFKKESIDNNSALKYELLLSDSWDQDAPEEIINVGNSEKITWETVSRDERCKSENVICLGTKKDKNFKEKIDEGNRPFHFKESSNTKLESLESINNLNSLIGERKLTSATPLGANKNILKMNINPKRDERFMSAVTFQEDAKIDIREDEKGIHGEKKIPTLVPQSSTKSTEDRYGEGNCNLNLSNPKVTSKETQYLEPYKGASHDIDNSSIIKKSDKTQDASELMIVSLVPEDALKDEPLIPKGCESFKKARIEVKIMVDEIDKCSNMITEIYKELPENKDKLIISTSLAIQTSTKNSVNEGNCDLIISESKLISNEPHSSEPCKIVSFDMDDLRKGEKSSRIQDAASRTIELMNGSLVSMDLDNNDPMVSKKCTSYEKSSKKVSIKDDETDKCPNEMRKSYEELQISKIPENTKVGTKTKAERKRSAKRSKSSRNKDVDLKTIGTEESLPVKALTDETKLNTGYSKIGNKINSKIEPTMDFQVEDITDEKYSMNQPTNEREIKQYQEDTSIDDKSLEKIGIRKLLNKIEELAPENFQLESKAKIPVINKLKPEYVEVEFKPNINENDYIVGMEIRHKINESKIVIEGIDKLATRDFSINRLMSENTNKPTCKYVKVEDSFNQQRVKNETEKQSTKNDFQMKQINHSASKFMVEEVDYSLCNHHTHGNMNEGKFSFEELVIGSKEIYKAKEIEFEKLEKNFANLKKTIGIRGINVLADEPTFGDECKLLETKADEQEKLTPRPTVERSISKELNNLVNFIENTLVFHNLQAQKPFKSGAQENQSYEEILSENEKMSRVSLVSTDNFKESLEEIRNKRSMELVDCTSLGKPEESCKSECEIIFYTPKKIPEDLPSTLVQKTLGVASTVNKDKELRGNQSISDSFPPKIISGSPEIPPPFTLKKTTLIDDVNKHLPPDCQQSSISGKTSGNVIGINKCSKTKCISDVNTDSKNKSSTSKPDYIISDPSRDDLSGCSTDDCSEDLDTIYDFDNRTLIIVNSSLRSSNGIDSDFSSDSYKSRVENRFGEIMSPDYSSNCSLKRSKAPNFESSCDTKENLSKIQTLVDQIPNPLSVGYFMNIPFQCSNKYFLQSLNTRPGMHYNSGNLETNASILDEISQHEKDNLESHLYVDKPQRILDLRLNLPLSQSELSEKESNLQANLEKGHTEQSGIIPIDRPFRMENRGSYLHKFSDQNLKTMEPCYNRSEIAIDYTGFENNESNFNEPTSEKSYFMKVQSSENTERSNKTNKMHDVEVVNEENLLSTPFVPLYTLDYPFYVQNDNSEHVPFKPNDLMNYKQLVPVEKLITGVHICSKEFEDNLWRASLDDSQIGIINKNNVDGKDSPSVKGKKTSEKSNLPSQKLAKRFDEKHFDTNSFSWNAEKDYQSRHTHTIERNNDQKFCKEHQDEESKETLVSQESDEVHQDELNQELIDRGFTQNDGVRNSSENKLCQYFLVDQDSFYSLRFPSRKIKSKSNFSNTKIIDEPLSRTENILFSEPYQFLNPRLCLGELTDMLPKLKRKSEIKVIAEKPIFKCIIITMNTDINDHLRYSSPYSLKVVVNDSENGKTIITPSYTSLTDTRITYWKKEKPKTLPILEEMTALKLDNENVTIKRTKEVDMGSMLLNDSEKVEIRGKLLDYWKYFLKTDFAYIPTQNFLHHLFKQNIPFFNCNKDADEIVVGEGNAPTFSSIPAPRPKLFVFERQSIPTVNLEIFQALVKNTKLHFREIAHDEHSDETPLKLPKTGFHTPVSTLYPENPQKGKKKCNYETDATIVEKGRRSTDLKSLAQEPLGDENEIQPNEITTLLKHARERGAMATIENISKLRVLTHRLRTIPRWKYGSARTPNPTGVCGAKVGLAFMLVLETKAGF